MATPIVDQFGRPYEIGSAHRYIGTEDTRYRLDRPRLDADMALLLSREKHKMIVRDARWIRETYSLVAGAVDQKADYVTGSGFFPEFVGRDRAWGKLAVEKLSSALNIADVRGELFDWDELWWTICTLLDVDGAIFPLLTETPTGFPQIQTLESHRIGSRGPTVGLVGEFDAYSLIRDPAEPSGWRRVTGLFTGRRIINGIIYDSAAREIGYRILGADPTQDRDIPAADMVHITHPKWLSDGRPFPPIAFAALDWYDVKEARDLQKQQQKVHASLSIVESNETGQAPAIPSLSEAGGAPAKLSTNGEPQVQMLQGGLVRYVRSGGGDIKAHESGSPSEGWRTFDQIVTAGAFYAMGWRMEMMDLSRLGGAGVRGFQDNINTAILARHKRLARPCKRIIRYFVAKLIARGDLPENTDWWRWEIPIPAEFSVDAARAQQQDRENIRFGLDSTPAAIRRSFGCGPERILRDEADYLATKKAIAAEFGLQPDELGTRLKVGDSADTVQRISPDPTAPA
jgi:hypothetical protein